MGQALSKPRGRQPRIYCQICRTLRKRETGYESPYDPVCSSCHKQQALEYVVYDRARGIGAIPENLRRYLDDAGS